MVDVLKHQVRTANTFPVVFDGTIDQLDDKTQMVSIYNLIYKLGLIPSM